MATHVDYYLTPVSPWAFLGHDRFAAILAATGATVRVLRMSEFYYQYWIRHPEYFQIFWAIDNQSVIGQLPASVVEAVSRLWEQNLKFLNALLEQSVAEGDLRECDCWELANILWTTANALIQSDATRARRELRRMPLDELYEDAIRYILRGLAAPGSRLLD